MTKTVLVACKLPAGMILEADGIGQVRLNGANSAYVPGAPGLTHVPEDKWLLLETVYASHSAFTSQAIFATGSDRVADVSAMADELKDERTGFEGLDPQNPATGIKPSEDSASAMAKLIEANTQTATPTKAVEGADAAAALELATTVKAPARKGRK